MTTATASPTAEKKFDFLHAIAPTKSLLVIEDDLSLVQFIDHVLEDQCEGLEWEYVTSGEAAMELIRRRGRFHGWNVRSFFRKCLL
jgi:hypothetical protein